MCALLEMFKECIKAQGNLQQLICWDHLEKLEEMFLNTFHREHILRTRPSNNSRHLIFNIIAVDNLFRFMKMVKCLPEFEHFYCIHEK